MSAADDLREIKEQMRELLDQAKAILGDAPQITRQRAEAYWMAHIRCALDDDHEFAGGSMVTLQDSINELEDPGDGR